MKNIRIIETNYNDKYYWKESTKSDTEAAGEMKLVELIPEDRDVTIRGFGGAFTEAAAHTYSQMNEDKKDRLISDLYGKDGLRYNMGRIHMNSCDFALGNYTYIEENDVSFDSFDIAHDEKEIIPMINDATNKLGKQPVLIMAPWSPPAFMKTNKEMNHGGKLLEEYADVWAGYFVRFIEEYKKRGINISYLTAQNEPMAVQTWDSCVYTDEEEAAFINNHLGPALESAGLLDEVKIFAWDHNKERAYRRLKVIMDASVKKDYVSGLAVHWYTGDHFENLSLVRKHYPNKEIFFSEGCVEYSILADANDIQNAEMYAHQMIGNLNSGCSAIIDWNLLVDYKGGPNHAGNFCDAPIKANEAGDDYEKKLSYYYIGHFSRYIKEGAKHIFSSRYTDKLEVAGFVNPDGERIVVVLNKSEEDVQYYLTEKDVSVNITIGAHTIQTVSYFFDWT